MVSILDKGTTCRTFARRIYTNQMFGVMYRIELQDGNIYKSIWLGGDCSYVQINNKTYRFINEPEGIIAELEALLVAV